MGIQYMKGKKTYTGLIVSGLGILGVAKYFGTPEELVKIVDLIIQICGLLYAAYGRYKATKK